MELSEDNIFIVLNLVVYVYEYIIELDDNVVLSLLFCIFFVGDLLNDVIVGCIIEVILFYVKVFFKFVIVECLIY